MGNETGKALLGEFAKAAAQAPAIYFAPIIGALAGIASQWRKNHPSEALSLHKAA
jgi:hypothetical protein